MPVNNNNSSSCCNIKTTTAATTTIASASRRQSTLDSKVDVKIAPSVVAETSLSETSLTSSSAASLKVEQPLQPQTLLQSFSSMSKNSSLAGKRFQDFRRFESTANTANNIFNPLQVWQKPTTNVQRACFTHTKKHLSAKIEVDKIAVRLNIFMAVLNSKICQTPMVCLWLSGP